MGLDRGEVARLGGIVVASTLVLTAAFIGVLALVDGGSEGLRSRLPAYVLVMAVAFAGAVVLFEQRYDGRSRSVDGRSVIATACGFSLTVFLAVLLSGEGVTYALRESERVVASEVFLYFVAAGLIGTGLGYWGLRHWREFARRRVTSSSGRL